MHQWLAQLGARLAQPARRAGRRQRRWCWSSAAICSSAIRTRSSTRRRRSGARGPRAEPADAERRDRRAVRVAAGRARRCGFRSIKARVAPDIHFIGFDLTLDEVRGDPRLDETAAGARRRRRQPRLVLRPAGSGRRAALRSRHRRADRAVSAEVGQPRLGQHRSQRRRRRSTSASRSSREPAGADADGVQWGSNAADMAYILYQKPVMVAVHGRNMLKNLKPAA